MTEEEKTGGPAFPSTHESMDPRNPGWVGGGMTLRDYFASIALPAILAQKDIMDQREWVNAAWIAYRLADKMIDERSV